MSTVPEPRDLREVEPGTVGALLRFLDRYQIPPETPILVWDDRLEDYVDVDRVEFRVTDGGGTVLVFKP